MIRSAPCRIAAHQVLGAAERVVEEVRLDLRVQQRSFATASSFSVSVSLVAACSSRRTSAMRREIARLIASAFSRLVPLSTVNQSSQAPPSGSQTRFTVPVSACGVMVAKIWLCVGAEPPEHPLQQRHRACRTDRRDATFARICRLSRALSTCSTLGSSRIVASRMSNARPASIGISICRRCRLASVPAFGAAVDEADPADVRRPRT